MRQYVFVGIAALTFACNAPVDKSSVDKADDSEIPVVNENQERATAPDTSEQIELDAAKREKENIAYGPLRFGMDSAEVRSILPSIKEPDGYVSIGDYQYRIRFAVNSNNRLYKILLEDVIFETTTNDHMWTYGEYEMLKDSVIKSAKNLVEIIGSKYGIPGPLGNYHVPNLDKPDWQEGELDVMCRWTLGSKKIVVGIRRSSGYIAEAWIWNEPMQAEVDAADEAEQARKQAKASSNF